MTTARNAAITVSCYLLAYLITLNVNSLFFLAPWLLIASPLLLVWMVITILKDTRRPYPSLGNHEWGYADKQRDDLGTF